MARGEGDSAGIAMIVVIVVILDSGWSSWACYYNGTGLRGTLL